jgi:L-aspartate semialdehyde sulfurtransferase ferredoxin
MSSLPSDGNAHIRDDERTDTSEILRLNYPPALVDRPVVAGLVSSFGLEVNILRARVTREDGWLIVELNGDPRRIADAREWLACEGIEIVADPPLDDGG